MSVADLKAARTPSQRERASRELLKHTPMFTESFGEKRRREEAHRALPRDEQPHMVCYMGMLGYKVLWIAEDGSAESLALAERERDWWGALCADGFYMLTQTREPYDHEFMVRQQWDLDALTRAILSSY